MSAARYFTCGLRNEWRRLLLRSNCTSFTFWCFEIELDRVGGTLDVEVMLLGLGFYLCIAILPPSKMLLDAIKEIAESKAGEHQR